MHAVFQNSLMLHNLYEKIFHNYIDLLNFFDCSFKGLLYLARGLKKNSTSQTFFKKNKIKFIKIKK